MMAGRFSRTYSRKRTQPIPPISQFDALVKEGSTIPSNQPAATKTAGHIGKWGTTSFTSLRAINGGIGKEDVYKRSYSVSQDSPGSSPAHCGSSFDTLHNNGDLGTNLSMLVKPVVTYKRRKFFKSRGDQEEPVKLPDNQHSTNSSSGVSSGGDSITLAAAAVSAFRSNDTTARSKRNAPTDFDSLLSSNADSTTIKNSKKATTTISLPTTLPDEAAVARSSPTKLPSYTSMSSATESTGIKLKIFKSRTSESSWSQNEYSSKVELPSDDSKSSTASSSAASSPSSVDVNDLEKDTPNNRRHPMDRSRQENTKYSGRITEENSRYPCQTNQDCSTATAVTVSRGNSYLGTNNSSGIFDSIHRSSSLSSTDSLLPQSSSHTTLTDSALSLDTTVDHSSINATLDSSTEFGEIIDQGTGLPISLYNKATDLSSASIVSDIGSPLGSELLDDIRSGKADDVASRTYGSPGFVKDPSPPLASSAVTRVKNTYTKNVSKSREINKYLTKNSEALKKEVNDSKLACLPSTSSIDVSHSTKTLINTDSSDNSNAMYNLSSKFNTKSYGNKNKSNLPHAAIAVNNNLNKKQDLDVRNDCNQISLSNSSVNIDDSNLFKCSDTSKDPSSNVTKNNKVPDLFSSGFDEEEIVDRTLVDYDSPCADSGADSNGAVESESAASATDKNTQELEAVSAATPATSTVARSQSSTGSGSLLRKCQSLPIRSVLRSTSENLLPSSCSTTNNNSSKLSGPTTRKRSIFKSRVIQDDGSKKRATYNHKWHSSNDDKDEDGFSSGSKSEQSSKSQSKNSASSQDYSAFDDFEFDSSGASLKRVQTWSTQSSTSLLPDLDGSDQGSKITSVKCPKAAKQYYTVIKNVKKLHQLQESGEFQEFNDDVEYFLDALRSSNSSSTRCLAALNLAHKCMVPAFRMHLRAHATVCKFFSALHDAPKHPGLSVCSAMVMFALSQDRLNMDLDRDSLELMLNLLDSDTAAGSAAAATDAGSSASGSSNGTNSAMGEAMTKIRDLCRQLQKKGHAKHLDLDSIDAGSLAMETLLSLTSKRAGEWFKEELRELGGVDHLIRTVTNCVHSLVLSFQSNKSWERRTADTFSKVERCLKVLENITHQNESNQGYLLQYKSGVFTNTLMELYQLCHDQIPKVPAAASKNSNSTSELTSPKNAILPKSPPSTILVTSRDGKKKHAVATEAPKKREQTLSARQCVSSALITAMKVLVNLTHNSLKLGLGSKTLGSQSNTYNITLRCLLVLPDELAAESKFEVMVLSCCLLLNLVEHSTDNRAALINTDEPHKLCQNDDFDLFSVESSVDHGAMRALVKLFYSSEASAKEHEAHTDQIIDRDLDQTARNKRSKEEKANEDDIDQTVAKLLQKAGRHMEDTLIAAYTALLTGYCIMDNKEYEEAVREMQPDENFRSMVVVLKKFFHFMDLTATTSILRSLKPAERVVKYMEKLDPPLKPSNSVAEKEKRERERRERGDYDDDDDLDDDDMPPSDSLSDAFGF
uniref:Protein wings apart-like n=1 Tax=Hirondellea gigas TaxID=1518452 RepID=A0A6A7FXN6_9CRUS